MIPFKYTSSVCFFVLCLLYLSNGYTQELDSTGQAYWIDCHTKIQTLAPNHEGKTASGNTYKLVAIKHRKDWLFIVSDSISFDSYFKFHKNDSLFKNSLFFDNNLCRLAAQYIEPDPKPKQSVFGELVLSEYYQITKDGKKFYEQIVETETGNKSPGFFAKLGKAVLWPADKLLGLQKIADMKKAVEDQKKAIETKLKEIQDIKAQSQALATELDQLKKENETLKTELEESKKEPEWETYPPVLEIIEQEDTNLSDSTDINSENTKNMAPSLDSLNTQQMPSDTLLPAQQTQDNLASQNILPEQNIAKDSVNQLLTDSFLAQKDSLHRAEGLPSQKDSSSVQPLFRNPKDSLQYVRIQIQQNLKKEAGQASEGEKKLELSERIIKLKADKQALDTKHAALTEELIKSTDPQASREINKELLAIEKDMKKVLEDLKTELQKEKEALEQDSSNLR